MLKPSFDSGFSDEDGPSFLSVAVFTSGRVALSEGVRLAFDLPFAHYGVDEEDGRFGDTSYPKTAVGNPYLGAELVASPRLDFALGVRLPLAPRENFGVITGQASDLGRFTAFDVDRTTLRALADYHKPVSETLRLRLRGGLLYSVYTGEGFGDFTPDNETYATYGAQGWYEDDALLFGAGLKGIGLLSADGGSIADRTFHTLGLALIGKFDGVQPGFVLEASMDERYNDLVSVVYGLTLTMPF